MAEAKQGDRNDDDEGKRAELTLIHNTERFFWGGDVVVF